MRSCFFVLVCTCLFHYAAEAQANYLDTLYRPYDFAWDLNYGNTLKLNDTSYVITGYGLTMQNHFIFNLFAINLKGDTLWDKSYDFGSKDLFAAYKAVLDNDKNILIAGPFFNDSLQGYQAMLFKTDSMGNKKWLKTYGISHYGHYQGLFAYVPIATIDRHYLIASTLGIDSVNADFLVIKTDTNGNEESRWQYGTPKYETLWAGIQAIDSGFIFAGETTVSDTPDFYTFSIYTMKVDKNGNELWKAIYASPYDTTNNRHITDAVTNDVIEDTDGYVFVGHRYSRRNYVLHSSPFAYLKAWVAKLDKQTGHIIWEQNIGINNATYQRFYKITKTSDGGYAACGIQAFSNQNTTNDSWLVKTNTFGDSIWSRRFYYANDTSLETEFYSITQTYDDGYLISGFAYDYNGDPFPWVIITDSMGCLIPGCDTLTVNDIKVLPDDKVGVVIYPNPASNVAYILIKSDIDVLDLSFRIYALTGQIVTTKTSAITDVTYLLNTSNFAKGVYLVDVMSQGKVVTTRRLVKE